MEQVILVDEQDNATGAMPKMEAHLKGRLHRAFSVFIFNDHHEMLLQQRSADKYHSAGLWSNTCCSHPRPGEETLQAASRRLEEEMGFTTALHKIFDFVYQAPFDNGLTEHEFDHVFIGYYNGRISPDPAEVKGWEFATMEEIASHIKSTPELFTAWFHIAFPKIVEWRNAKK